MPTPHDVIKRLERDYQELLENCRRSNEISNRTIENLMAENKYLREQLEGRESV